MAWWMQRPEAWWLVQSSSSSRGSVIELHILFSQIIIWRSISNSKAGVGKWISFFVPLFCPIRSVFYPVYTFDQHGSVSATYLFSIFVLIKSFSSSLFFQPSLHPHHHHNINQIVSSIITVSLLLSSLLLSYFFSFIVVLHVILVNLISV